MLHAHEIVATLLAEKSKQPAQSSGQAFAPSNIALIKYWGKRDAALNLPLTSSLSISLGDKGCTTKISLAEYDQTYLEKELLAQDNPFHQRLMHYLDSFRFTPDMHFCVQTTSNIPIGAGLASSAAGFGALVLALNQLFQWDLSLTECSILARLGSGSACRSLWQGFVEWQCGEQEDGLDSYAKPLPIQWPELCIGLHIFSDKQKLIGSREAMNRTTQTSLRYKTWPERVANDLVAMKQALEEKDFDYLGKVSEANAIAMHATMQAAHPPICYSTPATLAARDKVLTLRQQGLPIYITQDAGPNLKYFFEKSHLETVKAIFPELITVQPFAHESFGHHCAKL